MTINFANRNTLWASLFVDALAKQGLQHAVIGAGSRSTPLTFAFAAHPQIQSHSFIDERSAGFFALGIAKASSQPVALVCTSGTAAANFYPAIIEANYGEVPLLVLTADRPAELVESGANQTINQFNLYGDHVRWFHNIATPEAQPSDLKLRYVQTTAARAYFTALHPLAGAVHLNFPFDKPLEPTPIDSDFTSEINIQSTPIYSISQSKAFDQSLIDALSDKIATHTNGLIICGPEQKTTLSNTEFASQLGYPILADPLSPYKFNASEAVLGLYENYITSLSPADIIIRIGNLPTSKNLNQYLSQLPVDTHQIHITENGRWRDDGFNTDWVIQSSPEILVEAAKVTSPRADLDWLKTWQNTEQLTRTELNQHLDHLEAGYFVDTFNLAPPDSAIFVTNSLPIRHVDQFVAPSNRNLKVFANRGASGIDGQTSSALGVATANPSRPTTLVTGDLSFLHDIGGLLAIKRLGLKLIIIVINNDGGGIFQRLPIQQFEPTFNDFFQTPHGMTFEKIAEGFGIDYQFTDSRADFENKYTTALISDHSTIIEIPSNGTQEEINRKAFLDSLTEKLNQPVEVKVR